VTLKVSIGKFYTKTKNALLRHPPRASRSVQRSAVFVQLTHVPNTHRQTHRPRYVRHL